MGSILSDSTLLTMLLHTIILSSLLALSVGNPVAQLQENGNKIIDGLLEKVNKALPAKLSIGDINGTDFHLTNVYVDGLEHGIHRVGNSTFEMKNGTIYLTASFSVASIGATANWKWELLHGTIKVSTSVVAIHAEISSSLNFKSHPKLDVFKMVQLGDFDISLTGVSIFDKVISKLAEDLINGPLKAKIISEIDEKLPPIIQTELDKVHI